MLDLSRDKGGVLRESGPDSAALGVNVYRLTNFSSDTTWLRPELDFVQKPDLLITSDYAWSPHLGLILTSIGYIIIPAGSISYWTIDGDELLRLGVRETKFSGEFVLKDISESGSPSLSPVVQEAFRDYESHYSFLPESFRFDSSDAYVDWVTRSIGSANHLIFEATVGSESVGFVFAEFGDFCVDILLAGVVPTFAGSGLYAAMFAKVTGLFGKLGIQRLQISTQASNIRVQREWAKLGLRPFRSCQRFHAWSPSFSSILSSSHHVAGSP